jgi:hypothetical protein
MSCDGGCISQSPSKGLGSSRSSEASSPTTQLPTNGAALKAFYYYVERIWLRTLRRRSQKDRFSWQRMHRLAADWIPKPRILLPYPDKRFAVTHPRWEPCAGIPPARIWAGGGQ